MKAAVKGYHTLPVEETGLTDEGGANNQDKDNGIVTRKGDVWKVLSGAVLGAVLLALPVAILGGTSAASQPQVEVLSADVSVLDGVDLLGVSRELATPEFHNVNAASPTAMNILYHTQIQQESKVDGGVIYQWQTPGADAENAIAELMAATFPRFGLPDGVNGYWTAQIRLARRNSGSKWHSHANGLPTGIQTIKRKSPTRWMSNRITGWSSVREFKVLVY